MWTEAVPTVPFSGNRPGSSCLPPTPILRACLIRRECRRRSGQWPVYARNLVCTTRPPRQVQVRPRRTRCLWALPRSRKAMLRTRRPQHRPNAPPPSWARPLPWQRGAPNRWVSGDYPSPPTGTCGRVDNPCNHTLGMVSPAAMIAVCNPPDISLTE
jgi:hypothetical protein